MKLIQFHIHLIKSPTQLCSEMGHAKPHTASDTHLVLGEETISGPSKGSSCILAAIPWKVLQWLITVRTRCFRC